MPEHLTHHFHVHTSGQQKRGSRMPQIVETDTWQARSPEQRVELVAEHADAVPRATHLIAKHQIKIGAGASQLQLFIDLAHAMAPEGRDGSSWQRDPSSTLSRLGLSKHV